MPDAAAGEREDYWRGLIPRAVPLVSLPFDRRRPPAPSYRRESIDLDLDAAFADRIRALDPADPPTAACLAALLTALFRYTRQEEMVVGAVQLVGEQAAAVTPLLPIRLDWPAQQDLSGRDLVRQLESSLADAIRHAPCPFDMMESWAANADPAYGARVFNVALCVASSSECLALDWPVSDPELGGQLMLCDVVLVAALGSGGTFRAIFDADLFDAATIGRLLGHVFAILEGMIRDPSASVLALPMVTDVESQQLLAAENTGGAPRISRLGAGTLHELFEAQVRRTPEAVAVTCAGRSLTYAELNAHANRIAHALRERGVGPDVLVGLCIDRSLELVVALIGILKAGGAYLPIDLAYPRERLMFMLDDARAPVLLTQSRIAADLPGHHAHVICLDDLELSAFQAYPASNPASGATEDSLAYVIYTSGTTGQPKGSLITHRNVPRLFTSTEHWFEFGETDVWTLFHSVAFDFSVWELWGALLYGGRLVVVPFTTSRSPETFYELLAQERVTVLNQTPSAFRQLMQAEVIAGQRPLSLRYVIFGGEALEMQTLRPWFDRHDDGEPRLVNMYGITETTVHVTYRPLSKGDVDSGSVIGVPIPDLQVHILDRHKQLVPVGVPGEMYVGGAGLGRGYLRRPELTEERFVSDHLTGVEGSRLYKTGDLARRLPSGELEFLGRIDDQVKIRGFRIELGEIEAVLCQHPAVAEAAVVVRQDATGEKRLNAYIVPRGERPGMVDIRDALRRRLPDYMVPAAFVFLDRMPLTASGKIDRKALPEPEPLRPELASRYAAPRTPVEEALAGIWSTVLRVPQVGIRDNFFELGGDSILALQVVALARRRQLKVTPALLFAHQTVAELAPATEPVADSRTGHEAPTGEVPLTPVQHWFFEQNLEEPQHYNQAFLFEVSQPIDRTLLEAALAALSRQHDALRLRFVRDGDRWRQSYSTSIEPAPLLWIDLRRDDGTGERQRLEAAAATAQASLNLESGPIWRVVFFDLGPGRPGRLLIVVHHLAVDGISWRPLIEDLETLYRQESGAGGRPELPARTSSFKTWAERLRGIAGTESWRSEARHWSDVASRGQVSDSASPLAVQADGALDTEGHAGTFTVTLPADDTVALLQRVPAAYNTQINDVLLTALLIGWTRWSGRRVLHAALEGHGREPLFDDVDLSRTVGWFTSIFPVLLELREVGSAGTPGDALKSVKEQLRRIPRRGIGYGVLRYLGADVLAGAGEPRLLVNYLGQIDQLVAGSGLFRFASEDAGPAHSPKQRRRYPLELNSFVLGGRLHFRWTCSASLNADGAIDRLGSEVLSALKEIITHCLSAGAFGRTPSDYPLAQLDQGALDRLLAGRRGIEDVYPLGPMQALFFSAHPDAVVSVFDQWHCSLRGPLDVGAFQQAWRETVQRHTILRSTIHDEGGREPVQMVHSHVDLPWTVEDWRGEPVDRHDERWSAFLAADRERPLALTDPPVMRLALVRLTEDHWKFLWSVPGILLDGWSWPRVFSDVSRSYGRCIQGEALPLEDDVRPYRDYLAWLQEQSPDRAEAFWRQRLEGFREPTPLNSGIADRGGDAPRFLNHGLTLGPEATRQLEYTARELQVTLNTLLQGAWALVLSRQSGNDDVIFGAAFAGRPTELPGAESIVGPFVNNLPVRVGVTAAATPRELLRKLHAQLLESSGFQFTPLADIQRCSAVPVRYRLFDSLVVFQNYAVDESARRLGRGIEIEEFSGPIHTAYPVLLLVQPGPALGLTFIYDRRHIARATVERWADDLSAVLQHLPRRLDWSVADLHAAMTTPAGTGARPGPALHAQSQNYVPPQSEMERCIAEVLQAMFGLERVSIDDNFFDLGGHSLLLLQTHGRLRKALNAEFPIVALFAHPTVRALAAHLGQQSGAAGDSGTVFRDRAERGKRALARLRERRAAPD